MQSSSSSSDSDFYSTQIEQPIVQGKCVACHVSGGLSGHTRLVFAAGAGNEGGNQLVWQSFVGNVDQGDSLILNKARGVNHGGATQLSSGSPEYADLSHYLSTIGGGNQSSSTGNSGDFYQALKYEEAEQTLRRAALLFAGRTPTEAESAAVTADAEVLGSTIKALMQGENFKQFLIRSANDRLLTDAFLETRFLEVIDSNTPFYPELADRRFAAYSSGDEQTIQAFELWMRDLRYGITRAPLELLAYIVENDLPYSQILTADFTMLNPQVAEIYNADLNFESNEVTEFKPGYNRGQILLDEHYNGEFVQTFGTQIFSHGDFVQYPHAGLLNEPVFLNRYPTTDTNRNRARARWTYLHFLDVDIEKSAARTTDPVALADTNNPTLNNPNCTVCHELMDPVAGAFQNYGNSGNFRDAWGGKDALPGTYKWANDGLYQEGDTWFSDMRLPGINGSYAPSANNSLQWLGQQIVNDPRFATASVKFWWQAVMSEALVALPENSEDQNFAAQLAAYEAQSALIDDLATSFRNGFNGGAAYNLKDLLVALVNSQWFRANGVDSGISEEQSLALQNVGAGRLLSPEELEAKSKHLLGFAWGERDAPWKADNRWSNLVDRYRIYYGGIDSDGIIDRAKSLNSLMSNVALAHATSVACPAVVLDFNRPEGEQLIFNQIDRYITPQTQFRENFAVDQNYGEGSNTFVSQVNLESGQYNLRLGFDNPYWDEATASSSLLLIEEVQVSNQQGSLLYSLGKDLGNIQGAEVSVNENGDNTGSIYWDENTGQQPGYLLWAGFIDVPLPDNSSGAVTITVKVARHTVNDHPVQLGVAVNNRQLNIGGYGEQLLRQQLQTLHKNLLGENLELDDEEISQSLALLTEVWQERINRRYPRSAIAWQEETCEIPVDGWWDSNRSDDLADPEHMQGAWVSVLIYLLTDYRYLHE